MNPAQAHSSSPLAAKHRAVSWVCEPHGSFVEYGTAVAAMEAQASAIREGTASEAVWLLQHPPLYTAGTSAKDNDLLARERFPVHRTGRGGQYTYHGPGQRVIYIMIDVRERFEGVRSFVTAVERWMIATLERFGVPGRTYRERVGVWVPVGPDNRTALDLPFAATQAGQEHIAEKKIAAVGIRLARWVSLHGAALNVCPDLSHFEGIIPCGLPQFGVTSLEELGVSASMDDVDEMLRETFEQHFGCATVPCGRLPVLDQTAK